MADAVVSLALRTFSALLLEETKFLYGISSEVKGLESQLKEMQCLLKDANKRQHESNSVRNWIAEVRDLAYRAEDVIETYAVEISSRKGKVFRKLLKRFSFAFNEGFTLHQIGSEILNIRSEMDRVQKSMQAFGIKEIIQGESSVFSASNENEQWKRQTYPDVIEDCFVGKEDDLNRLISLISDDKQHRIISIWGMGGIGKTTIARKVYNHFKTGGPFKSIAWVCITQQCQIRSVLEDVLKQLIPQQKADIMNSSNTQLVQLLCEVQRAKRCLIVLDDLWQIDHWNVLKQAFLVVGLNNKILLTTRNQDVAAVGFSYELELLKADDGWELLKKKAHLQDNVTAFIVKEKSFEKIGKEMVSKCGYLPLGICLLGGILSNKNSLTEWELVNKNMNAYLYKSDGNTLGGVMDLSYEDLPSYLKPCFLYMGSYGEDEIIYVVDLYRLWIAEGLISHENHGREETLMDIAELYLKEMVSRCIVQVYDLFSDQRYRTCKIHDLMRELCLSKGKDEDFRLKVIYYHYQAGKLSIMNPSFSSNKTRHLAIYFVTREDIKLNDGFTTFREEINNHHIRSLQFLKTGWRKIEFSRNVVDFGKLKLLRILVFENCIFEGGKLPAQIGNLICLRHLGLRNCVLDELPYSIKNLTYLYTLSLRGTWDVRIPNVLNKMVRLKSLHFPEYQNDKIEKYQLRLEGLEELESLCGFNSLVHDLKSTSKMKNLRELYASVHDNKTLCEIIDGINTHWDKLQRFMLYVKENCELTSSEEGSVVLKKVFACSKLISLSISVPIRKVPIYNVQSRTQIIFPNLQGLVLSKTEIEDDPMEMLEKLPFLEYLFLLEKSYEGELMICHAKGFPKLKTLKLNGLSNLKEWRIEEGAMSNIGTLKIVSCQNLKTIPDGLKFITTLQQLQIFKMPELGKRVSAVSESGQKGEDYHKVCHVSSIIVD